jgi:hypothetical protein
MKESIKPKTTKKKKISNIPRKTNAMIVTTRTAAYTAFSIEEHFFSSFNMAACSVANETAR